jgi:hypothetical protein
MISKYSVFVVGTRRINSTFRSKKFSVPLTSESVTSGQAGGVFRQLFFQWLFVFLQEPTHLLFYGVGHYVDSVRWKLFSGFVKITDASILISENDSLKGLTVKTNIIFQSRPAPHMVNLFLFH